MTYKDWHMTFPFSGVSGTGVVYLTGESHIAARYIMFNLKDANELTELWRQHFYKRSWEKLSIGFSIRETRFSVVNKFNLHRTTQPKPQHFILYMRVAWHEL